LIEEIDLLNMVEHKRNEIIELTRSLIRIPSVTGEERDCQNFVLDRLNRLGWKMDVWEPKISELKNHPAYSDVEKCEEVSLRNYDGRPNVVATLQGSGGGKSLILNGHVDVVPPGSREMWSHDPWGAELENGRLYGRGAVDMKGGLAAIIAAAETICEASVSLKGNLIVESVVDEESGGNGTLSCLLRGYTGDAAILTEPSQLMIRNGIALASTGTNQYRIKVKGRSGHPSNLQLAEYVSAIDKASTILGAIKNFNSIRQQERLRLNPPLYRMFAVTNLIGVGKVRAGEWFSMMPNLALIEGSMQCYPGENLEETKKKFTDYITSFANLDPWMRSNPPEIEFFGIHIIPTEIGTGEPIVTTVQDSARKIWKAEPMLMGLPGGSDLRIFTEYGKIPALLFGPGGGGLHAVDEFVIANDVIDITKAIVSTICSWCRMER
jgi:acetylornithine deacetylase